FTISVTGGSISLSFATVTLNAIVNAIQIVSGGPLPAPTVTAISPTSGSTAGGTAVTISGTNFVGGATVSIGGSAASGVTVVNSGSITATTPAHSAGSADVVVTNPDAQTGTLAAGYSYVAPPPNAPTVTAINPPSGPLAGGTSVTITGTNFTGATAVKFGTLAASSFTLNSGTSITAPAPAGQTAGTVDVTVTTPNGTSATATADQFTYVAPFSPIRLNVGGGAYTDTAGNAWSADTGASGGTAKTTSGAVTGTADPTLYLSERYGNFSYAFSVPNGTYAVTLKFADLYNSSPGQRVFNVSLNGQQVLTNFDIIAQVGPHAALDKTFTISVTGGSISLSFATVTLNAIVNAIQIAAGIDTVPSVVATSPTAGAIGVYLNQPISVAFSQPMNQSSVQSAFSISPSVTGTFFWNSDGTNVTFTPSSNMNSLTQYAAVLSTAAQDLAGTPLAAATSWTFTTGTTIAPGTGSTTIFSWTTQAAEPLTLMEAQGIAYNGKLYVFGGFDNANLQATPQSNVFDPSTNAWTRLADMPEAVTHAAVEVDPQTQTIYLVGGFVGNSPGPSTTHVWKYSVVNNTWSAGPD
ncbi:MAG TPA: malectin domain-containing carbohydrate-binding protein, partial [Chloroflexota bacterium]